MRLCQKAGCGQPATHAIQIGCGEIQDPDDAPARATVLLGVVVCEPCLDGEDVARWFDACGETLRPLLALAIGEGRHPDFGRATVTGVPLSSPEYQHLLLEGLKAKGH